MPNIYFAPPARQDPYAFANRDAIMQMFNVIGKSKRENFETEILQRYLADPEQDFSSMMSQEEPEGFFGRMWDVVNPRGTYRGGVGGLSPFTQRVMAQAMGVERVGTLPGWWNRATPEQQQGYLDRVGGQNINIFGNLPGYLQGETPEETKKNVEAYRKKQLETEEAPLSEPQVAGYGEAMDARIKRVDRFRPGFKDFKEADIFKEWQKFVGMYQFKNDTQRRQVWNVWKNKLNNLGNELDWDPTAPKWLEAIGLPALQDSGQAGLTTEIGVDIGEEARKRIAWEAGYYKPPDSKYSVGDTVIQKGRRYRITGFDEDGTPLGELIP